MNLLDSFKLSFNSVLHRKMRAWLTLLGIVIGVAAVVSIISLSESAQANVSSRLSGFGADIITLSPGGGRAGGFGGEFRGLQEGGGIPGGGSGQSGARGSASSTSAKAPVLTSFDASIIRSHPNVWYVNELVSGGRLEVIFGSETTKANVSGVNPSTWKNVATSLSLSSGRFLSVSDSSAIVIGNSLANKTFRQPITLGRQISEGGSAFTVVGILAPSGSSFGGGNDSAIYMPYQSVWAISSDVNKGNFSSIEARLRSTDGNLVDETISSLTSSLLVSRRVVERTKNFSLTSPQSIQQQIAGVTQTLTLFLVAIAAVSLLVGAVGVANSMFTSVLEKTKEIGILKALGSTDYEIMQLFVIESGLFGLVGGIIGTLLGSLASVLLSGSLGSIRFFPGLGGQGMTFQLNPELVLAAILLSTIIGMVAGFLPARAASRLKPVEALRYE